jgi:hypothetical protein
MHGARYGVVINRFYEFIVVLHSCGTKILIFETAHRSCATHICLRNYETTLGDMTPKSEEPMVLRDVSASDSSITERRSNADIDNCQCLIVSIVHPVSGS